MRPDVILTWPVNCDYPLWREWLAAERDRFARVLITFTPHDGLDLHDFVMENLTCDVEYYHSIPGPQDWRDAAVKAALAESDAEWVWFTEQDFRIRGDWFWPTIEAAAGEAQAIGTREGLEGRWHPCCLFARREAIERTHKYFGPDPVDHFYSFGRELPGVRALEDYALYEGRHWTHMAGLSRNHQLIEERYTAIYKPQEFGAYLEECLRATVELEGTWRAQAEAWLSKRDEARGYGLT